ncbi:MAG: HDOD domain-containing protein [Rhodocyclales bacterium]|nr:HDOD domain-containing protein [Rhodocyclales bacterium]
MRPIDPEQYAEFKASGRLPSPKGVALAVIRLLRNDNYEMPDLVRLLQSDPAMAGRLLRFANAAAVGSTRPVVGVGEAVLILGAQRIRDLVLGFSLLRDYRNGRCEAFRFETFWSRSLATAIGAQTRASQAQIAGEEFFTLGLLCDIGILALVAYDCGLYGEALRRAERKSEGMSDAERAVFGIDHRELGAALMAEWGLPTALTNAAYHSETPDAGGLVAGSRQHALALSIQFARTLADICIGGGRDHSDLLPELYVKGARLGIGPNDLAAFADDVVRRWRDWGAALQVQTREVPPFADIMTLAPP